MGEEGAGAAEAGHDFVGDQVHAVAIAQRARLAQVFRVVHRHAGRALHQRFDDQCGGARVMLLQMLLQRAARSACAYSFGDTPASACRQSGLGTCALWRSSGA